VDISFDAAKNARNIATRGISFQQALVFEWDSALIVADTRSRDLEKRTLSVYARPTNVRWSGMKRKRNPERADRENPVWTKETFLRARKAREVLPKIFGKQVAAKMLKPRGRPKTGNARTSISLRLPQDTLARWKATGPGWQTRMAETLRKAV
jgi:uncharacterized protein (DUF4415 family)